MSFVAESTPHVQRKVPREWDAVQKKAYLEIATRAQTELFCSFTAIAIGLQIYRENFVAFSRLNS